MSKEQEAFHELELLSAAFPGEPWCLQPDEKYFSPSKAKEGDYSRRLKQGRAAHPPEGSTAITTQRKELTTGQRVASLDAFTDQLLTSSVPVADRLIHLRQQAAELNLNLRDTDLQRKLWEARRRRSGAVEMFTPEMETVIEADTWAWDGILMAGDTNLIAALPKVGKSTLLIDAIARWHRGDSEHLGRAFYGQCPPVIVCGTDMPRRMWMMLLARFGLAVEVRPKVYRLLPGGPIVGLFSQDSPIYLDSTGISRIAELTAQHPGALLLVDSYAKCTAPLGLKEASSDYAGPLGDLQDAVAPSGATMAVIHHSGHSRVGEGAVAACRGTSALPAAVSQVVAMSWLNRAKGTSDKRVVLQTEGRGGEPLQLLIEQENDGWVSHGDAGEAFQEQRLAEAEEELNDRQEMALEVVRERWAELQQRTTGGDLIEALDLKGSNAPRIARRMLQQLLNRGLVQSSKESTPHGAVVWFWPVGQAQGVPSPCSLSPMSGVSPLSPPTPEKEEEKTEIADAGREGTLRTHRTGGTDKGRRGHPVSPVPGGGDTRGPVGLPVLVDGQAGWTLPSGRIPRAGGTAVIDPAGQSRHVDAKRIRPAPPMAA